MKNTLKRIALSIGFASFSLITMAQQRILIHSHNDYEQIAPFYQAYAQCAYSIEVDVFAIIGELLVGHDKEKLSKDLTFDELYLNPILKQFNLNKGRAWKDSDDKLQLMIELKSSAEPTLSLVVEKLKKYPEVFNAEINPNAVKVVITGNVPKPSEFSNYPSFIFFDGNINDNYTSDQLSRLGLISVSLRNYTDWNGKGSLKLKEKKAIENVIAKVHAMGKPIRFWGTPNSITFWNTFHRMGVDIINTDRLEACVDFFRNYEDKNYQITESESIIDGITKTDRLDKTTKNFEGFKRQKLQLKERIEVYTPTYLNDGLNKKVKNVIFIIGDGMGIAQMNAAETVNKELTVFKMKNMGMLRTVPQNSYVTDSAAGGSALATGESHTNRYISISDEGLICPSMTDVAYSEGKATGIVTWGNVADATPAAFYGHSTERDNADEIMNYLLDGKLTLLNGSGSDLLKKRKDSKQFIEELEKKYRLSLSIDDINVHNDKVICIDDRMDQSTNIDNLYLLSEATKQAITKLEKSSDKGFFLMVEGAKIDYAGHANTVPGAVVEMLGLDLAIKTALEFADSNGETLVIVTADHETGGLTLVDGDKEKGLVTARFMTDDHTPIMVPVFAYGPGSSSFRGIYNNTDIFSKITTLLTSKDR